MLSRSTAEILMNNASVISYRVCVVSCISFAPPLTLTGRGMADWKTRMIPTIVEGPMGRGRRDLREEPGDITLSEQKWE